MRARSWNRKTRESAILTCISGLTLGDPRCPSGARLAARSWPRRENPAAAPTCHRHREGSARPRDRFGVRRRELVRAHSPVAPAAKERRRRDKPPVVSQPIRAAKAGIWPSECEAHSERKRSAPNERIETETLVNMQITPRRAHQVICQGPIVPESSVTKPASVLEKPARSLRCMPKGTWGATHSGMPRAHRTRVVYEASDSLGFSAVAVK
ncbi:hypothetical protein MRX96_007048 [Rhipicephalus microplus]